MNISFQGTYKIYLSKNPDMTSEIFRATDEIYNRTRVDALMDYPKVGHPEVLWTIPVDDCYNKKVDSILTSRGIKFERKDYPELYDKNEIKKRITLPHDYPENRFQLVEVDTEKFNKAYKAHSFAYIGDYKNVEFKERYDRFHKYIRTDRPIDASIVYARDEGTYPQIDFNDGRHRYAYMRNIGMEKIPLAMNEETKEVLKKYDLL